MSGQETQVSRKGSRHWEKGFRWAGGDTGDRMRDTDIGMRDPDVGMRDPDVGMRDTGGQDGTLGTGQRSLVMG